MATDFETQGVLTLDAVWWRDPPEISVGLDDDILYKGSLRQQEKFSFDRRLDVGTHRIWVEFTNKHPNDTNVDTGQDKAVLIKQIDFFGI